MDDFKTINSGSGLLKDTYGDSGLSDALKKKRKKMAEDRGIVEPENEQESDSNG